MRLRQHGVHLVTQPQIQCQVRLPPPIVLHVKTEESCTEIARCKTAGDASLKGLRFVLQESAAHERSIGIKLAQRPKLEDSIRIGKGSDIQAHGLDRKTKFHRMLA